MAMVNGKSGDQSNKVSSNPAPSAKTLQGSLAGVKNVIAVASGKGGVGKSTVAANLAVALKYFGASVGLMDADIYGPSQPGMLGARNERASAPDGHIIPVNKHGVGFVSMGLLMGSDGPVVWRAPMAMKIIHQFIGNVAWGSLDYLIIDLPPGTGDVQLTLAQQASLSGAVIVTTPQDVALGIAKKGLQMFTQLNVPILGVIENMSGFLCGHCGEETAIFKDGGGRKMANELGVPFLGAIPLDPEIMASSDNGIPILAENKSSRAAEAYLALAQAFQNQVARVNGAQVTMEPETMDVVASGELTVQWPGGHRGHHSALVLRTGCVCAVCIDEATGQRILDPKRVPLDIKLTGVARVGRYAVAAQFSDGHSTGIYSFKRLLDLCECHGCLSEKNVKAKSFSV
jgi:ATP-binding protein involved in chromosome partitioning